MLTKTNKIIVSREVHFIESGSKLSGKKETVKQENTRMPRKNSRKRKRILQSRKTLAFRGKTTKNHRKMNTLTSGTTCQKKRKQQRGWKLRRSSRKFRRRTATRKTNLKTLKTINRHHRHQIHRRHHRFHNGTTQSEPLELPETDSSSRLRNPARSRKRTVMCESKRDESMKTYL
jgi:hypothetical protein